MYLFMVAGHMLQVGKQVEIQQFNQDFKTFNHRTQLSNDRGAGRR